MLFLRSRSEEGELAAEVFLPVRGVGQREVAANYFQPDGVIRWSRWKARREPRGARRKCRAEPAPIFPEDFGVIISVNPENFPVHVQRA